jgi:hypothetical protein
MLDFKIYLVNKIKNDTTLQGYLTDANGNINIFPDDVDIQPEQFPCITYGDAGITVLSNPRGMHIGLMQLNIWSTLNDLEIEEIHERLGQIFNFKDSTTETISGTLWWVREESIRDMSNPSRRLWRKICDLKFWANNLTNT